jgi:hypothetical protein
MDTGDKPRYDSRVHALASTWIGAYADCELLLHLSNAFIF